MHSLELNSRDLMMAIKVLKSAVRLSEINLQMGDDSGDSTKPPLYSQALPTTEETPLKKKELSPS